MKQEKNKKDKKRLATSGSFRNRVWKNVLILIPALIFVTYALSSQQGYNWVCNSLLRENLTMISKYPHLTFDQKMQMKLGLNYNYLLIIRNSTPPDAVILYPSPEEFRVKESPFTQDIDNKLYALRFLYPRKLVTKENLPDSQYAGKVTHVAIVNGMGKDRVPYPIDSLRMHGVFPIEPPTKTK